ncbi:MAG: DUF502 domain-containing protein [bacterium]
MARIKGYFITGIIAIIPIVATIGILIFSLKITRSLLSMPISGALGIKYGFLSGFLDLFAGIFITILVILMAGYITTKIGKVGIFTWVEGLMRNLPVVNSFYTSIKQLVDIFILNKAIEGFTRVALVEYPRKGLYAIGFVTAKSGKALDELTGKKLISIYVPKPLSVASGFLILVSEDDIIHLDIPLDEGFKMVVSAGLILPK